MTQLEDHPLVRSNPELAEQFLSRSMGDAAFARLAQRYAELDGQLQDAAAKNEHEALREQLLSELKPKSSCCGGCGGGGH